MRATTRQLWEERDRHEGDRKRLHTVVREVVDGNTVIYPGSFVDIAPSFVFPSVTYIDTDKRTPSFFADEEGITEIIASEGGSPTAEVRFIHGDYQADLGLAPESFDLLVSLYAGFVAKYCTYYLRVGGILLAAPSHGDVAMASIDPRYRLVSVIESRSGNYRIKTTELDSYLVPKSEVEITPAMLQERRRGIAYTRSPFGYLFQRVN
ncbi:MAG: hypothetical protein P1T08_08095 [Acidimicrobiia bacterium]|nr:hypothetical protein [Acidimicrobiia bacterium]